MTPNKIFGSSKPKFQGVAVSTIAIDAETAKLRRGSYKELGNGRAPPGEDLWASTPLAMELKR
jgi:hypothetical protein